MMTDKIRQLSVGESFSFNIPGATPLALVVSEQTTGDKFVGIDAKGITYTWMLTGLEQIPEIGAATPTKPVS